MCPSRPTRPPASPSRPRGANAAPAADPRDRLGPGATEDARAPPRSPRLRPGDPRRRRGSSGARRRRPRRRPRGPGPDRPEPAPPAGRPRPDRPGSRRADGPEPRMSRGVSDTLGVPVGRGRPTIADPCGSGRRAGIRPIPAPEPTGRSAPAGHSPAYCNLHGHTPYSTLDGHAPVDEDVAAAARHGHTHLAVTDHGTLAGSPHV